MKKVFFIISIIILLSGVYLILTNLNNLQPVHYIFTGDGADDKVYITNIALYTGLILFAGVLAGGGIVNMFLAEAKTKLKAYERELEKTSIKGENNASKADVFEAKIKTLETALNSVLDEKTKLESQVKQLNTEIEKYKQK